MAEKPGKSSSNAALEGFSYAGALGLEFAGMVAATVLIGWWLDRWLGTAPWLLITMLALGVGGGTYRFIRQANRANRPHRRREDRAAGSPGGPRDEPGGGAGR